MKGLFFGTFLLAIALSVMQYKSRGDLSVMDMLAGSWQKIVMLVDTAVRWLIAFWVGLTALQVLALFVAAWLFVLQFWLRQLGKIVFYIYWFLFFLYCCGIFIWIGYY